MDHSQPITEAMSPAEVFACLYDDLSSFGADLRGYDAIRPLGRLFPVRRDPALVRQLTVELRAVNCLVGLLGEIAEGFIAAPWLTPESRSARITLARLCGTADSCQTRLGRYLAQIVGPTTPLPDDVSAAFDLGWIRMQSRLMAPWS